MAYSGTWSSERSAGARPVAAVRIWLYVVAAMVVLMVGVGGATRLTGSGLSITEWKPIVGTLPPLSDRDWQDAFQKYRQIPQYEHVNKGMSLAAFKTIFWWEWAHRNLGRLIGAAFALPFCVFLALGYVDRRLALKLGGILALGGLQGLAGWYMVSSGLSARIDVSQYRLALHLCLAILILGALLWTALSLAEDSGMAPARPAARDTAAGLILGLVLLQILLGALVAGLKAGHAYNTWPLMDGRLVPSGLGAMEPWYLNLFENAMTVQFMHRMVAYTLVIAVPWRAAAVLGSEAMPGKVVSAAALVLAVLLQAALGIWTLLAEVPLALGIAHQTVAAVVFGLAVWHLFESRRVLARTR
jgi:cytochrome c oxidase assembly protein subunit 15